MIFGVWQLKKIGYFGENLLADENVDSIKPGGYRRHQSNFSALESKLKLAIISV